MKLSAISKGTRFQIQQLPPGDIRSRFIRLGMMEGSEVQCLERLPGGTMVLEFSRQEVAVSTELTDAILVCVL